MQYVSIFFAEKIPSDATFFGAQYFSYNLSQETGVIIDSNEDQVSLDFRTKESDGLLFYTGEKIKIYTVCLSVCLFLSLTFFSVPMPLFASLSLTISLY